MSKDLTAKMEAIVAAHKDHMTFKDMADEFDISEATIRAYCTRNGIDVVTAKQYKINYIRDMAGKHPVEWIAEKLGINPGHVRVLGAEANISLALQHPVDAVPVEGETGMTIGKWAESRRSAAIKELVQERMEEMNHKTSTIKTELTQGPSPFGLADEIAGRRFK